MITYPKIKTVVPLPSKQLLVSFSTGAKKVYDCTPLLQEENFRSLNDDAFFRNVQADSGGYGIIWNDSVDLSEAELWINGAPVEQTAA